MVDLVESASPINSLRKKGRSFREQNSQLPARMRKGRVGRKMVV